MDIATIGAADAPWMAERRTRAAAELESLGMPSTREEIWRYLDLDFDPMLDSAPATGGRGETDGIVEGWAGPVVSIVDGFVTNPDVALTSSADEPFEPSQDVDFFATAHAALSPGSALIGSELLGDPVLVDVQATSRASTFPGIHLDVPAGEDCAVVVRMRSTTSEGSMIVPVITGSVHPNARLSLTIVQDWNYATRSFGRCIITLERDAGLVLSEVGLGGRVGRLHLDVNLEGDGSHAEIYGAYFGEDQQTLDYRYFMNHIGRNTRCDMFLKGAVEDQALSVYTGLIRIEETGQKTESFQTNRNLILSEGASAQSVPNLEILANDVKCGHGSSVGPLDEEQRYYLMSRGLTPEGADRLQVRGFFEAVVSQIPDANVAAWARDRINDKYISAQEEGRV